jgi:nitronate monooxygenase
MRTPICDLFGIEHPVVSAPMAGVSGGALAAAVSRAGGLGMIGGGYADPAWLSAQLALAGNQAVGIGFITWALARQPAALDVALAHAPRAIMLSFGDIAPFMPRLKQSGVLVIVQVQTLAAARVALAEGADVLVAQGTEAGGHGGARATLPLVPAIVDLAGRTPVLAAGGIADGRGLAAALMLGAAGVLCGTAFYATEESLAHPAAKSRAVAATGDATARSDVFDRARGLPWPAEWNLRALRNEFSEKHHAAEIAPDQHAAFAAAVARADFDAAPVVVGEAVDLVAACAPAAQVLHAMVAGAEQRLRMAAGLLATR